MPALSSPKVDPRRYFESVREARGERAQRLPVCVYLETTNRCNLLCTTCPRTYAELEPPADMSWPLFTSIVDQIPDLERAVLHGVGEPMLVKHLPKMVRYLKDRGTYVLFNTNGTVLNERNGRALIEAGLDELRVSLDAANAKSFLAVRGKDYFGRILKNVRAFRALQEREGHDAPAGLGLAHRIARDGRRAAGLRAGRGRHRHQGSLPAAAGVLREGRHRPRAARPGALRAAHPRGAGPYRSGDRARARPRHDVFRLRRRLRARHEPQASRRRRLAVVAVPAALDGDVFHRQRPRAALLHRAVLAARLRELHAGRRHPAVAARDLGRAGLPHRSARRCCPTSRRPPARAAACAGAFEPWPSPPRPIASSRAEAGRAPSWW